jgi:hypothetical protein
MFFFFFRKRKEPKENSPAAQSSVDGVVLWQGQ